jgi:tetratricopeptide (TPR) repeat protein
VLFRDIAFNHKDSELAEYAANLYLDCLNVLGTQIAQPRVACVHELSASIDPMSASFCGTEQLTDEHPDLCGTLGNLQCQVRRKEAETYQKTQQFKKAAATYVRIFRRHDECGEMDEMLYNAAINFEAAHLLGRAIQVRTVLIERYPESKLSKKAVYLIGQNFQALAYYEQAAKYYEQFARKFPGEDGKRCTAEDGRQGRHGGLGPVCAQLQAKASAADLAGHVLDRLDLRAAEAVVRGHLALSRLSEEVRQGRHAASADPGEYGDWPGVLGAQQEERS